MKSLIAPILATASFATIVICSFAAASSLMAPYQPHHFKHIDASIWSDTPVQVNQQAQGLERLAAVVPAEPAYQTLVISDPLDGQKSAAQQTVNAPSSPMAANVLACRERYRSYRAEDNSYQPFDGGRRKPCDIGESDDPVATVKVATPSETIADNATADHDAWCSSRYSSYNPSDNTYQPFGGGARRQCVAPAVMASNG